MSKLEATSCAIINHPRFDLEDFRARWAKARISAIQEIIGQSLELADNREIELALLKKSTLDQKDPILRRVFDVSRRLGGSLSRYLGMTLEISDFSEILPKMGISCFSGAWKSHRSAQVLERSGCADRDQWGSLACDYWREALDGLVMGAGENERLARHRSMGHGDSTCLDVLYVEEFSIPRIENQAKPLSKSEISPMGQKFGPVPDSIKTVIDSMRPEMDKIKISLTLDGFSEGVLYYRMDAHKGVLCGAGGKILHDSFVEDLKKIFPELRVKDNSPLAVYGGST